MADGKEGLIVACEAVQDCNGERCLNAMIEQVDEQAGRHAERDVCICPHGGESTPRGTHEREDKGYVLVRYRCVVKDCPHRAQCTKDNKGRTIELTQYYEAFQGKTFLDSLSCVTTPRDEMYGKPAIPHFVTQAPFRTANCLEPVAPGMLLRWSHHDGIGKVQERDDPTPCAARPAASSYTTPNR